MRLGELSLCLTLLACGNANQAAILDAGPAEVRCTIEVTCANQRICDLPTARLPQTWCASSPTPHAVLAVCDNDYTSITFSTLGQGATYFYRGAVLVAALNVRENPGHSAPCDPEGDIFQLPNCALGTDLCAGFAAMTSADAQAPASDAQIP